MEKNLSKSNRFDDDEVKYLRNFTKDVIAQALKMGASAVEVATSVDKGLSVSSRLKEVETLEYNHDKGVGLTVYVGQRRGSVSSSDTSKDSVEKLIKRAIEIAKVSDEDSCFGLADKKLLSNDHPNLDLYHPWDIDGQQAIKEAIDCERYALSQDKRINNSEGASVSSYQFLRVYGNSHDFLGSYMTTRHSKSCVLLGQSDDSVERDYDYTTARNQQALTSNEELANSAVKKTLSRLNAKKIKTQKTPVIFSSEVSSSLLGILISAISGSSIYRRSSFLVDKIGQQILPSRYQVFEKPHLLGALGSAPYDGEGIITRDNIFVQDGVLKSYVLGSYSARRLGLETTANAGGVHNLTINHDALDFEALLKKMDTGLLVTELMGQGINLVTGDYSRGIGGFWVQGGVIQYPVHEVTVAGNLNEMLSGILAIANDEDTRKATNCGSIFIDEMTVAGD